MGKYDKLIVVGCSNARIPAVVSDLLLEPFKLRLTTNFSLYSDVLFFTVAGAFITQDVQKAVKTLKSEGFRVLVVAISHYNPQCRGLGIAKLKVDVLNAFKVKLNWSELNFANWISKYGFSIDDLFAQYEQSPLKHNELQAKELSRLGVDFVTGVTDLRRGVFRPSFYNINLTAEDRDLINRTLLKVVLRKSFKELDVTRVGPKYLALGWPGVNVRRVLRIDTVGKVFPVSLNPLNVGKFALASIAIYVLIMDSGPRLRLLAPCSEMKFLEDWVERDALISVMQEHGLRMPMHFIKA